MGNHLEPTHVFKYGIQSEWKGDVTHTVPYFISQRRRGSRLPSHTHNLPIPGQLARGPTAMTAAYAWRMWLNAAPNQTMLGPTVEDIHLAALQLQHLAYEGDPAHQPTLDDPFNTPVSSWYCALALAAQGTFEFPILANEPGEIRLWALHVAPLVLTTPIYQGMMYHEGDDAIIDGRLMGWNDYLIIGWSGQHKAARILGSEGRDWGKDGRKWLNRYDLEELLDQGAIALTAPVKRVGAEAHRAKLARQDRSLTATERMRQEPAMYVPFYARGIEDDPRTV